MKGRQTIAIMLTFLCIGCGYHFSQGGEHIDSGIQRIFIGEFANRTSEASIENYVRNAFFNRFRKGSRFTLVASVDEAEASLTGKIVSITTSHLAYSSSDLAKEDRVRMTLDMVFKRTDNDEVIWTNSGFSGKEAYTVDISSHTTAINKTNALKKLAVDMADKAYRNIMSGF